jgi:hypothetical protein
VRFLLPHFLHDFSLSATLLLHFLPLPLDLEDFRDSAVTVNRVMHFTIIRKATAGQRARKEMGETKMWEVNKLHCRLLLCINGTSVLLYFAFVLVWTQVLISALTHQSIRISI